MKSFLDVMMKIVVVRADIVRGIGRASFFVCGK